MWPRADPDNTQDPAVDVDAHVFARCRHIPSGWISRRRRRLIAHGSDMLQMNAHTNHISTNWVWGHSRITSHFWCILPPLPSVTFCHVWLPLPLRKLFQNCATSPHTNSVMEDAYASKPVVFRSECTILYLMLVESKAVCYIHCVPKKWRQNSNHYKLLRHILSEFNILLAALIIIFPT